MTKSVLIADDTEDMRLLLRIVLVRAKYVVVGEAKSGEEAVELWHEHKHIPLHSVILDHRMPGLMGLEVARRILAERPEQRVILFSAQIDDELRASAAELDVHLFSKDAITGLPQSPAMTG